MRELKWFDWIPLIGIFTGKLRVAPNLFVFWLYLIYQALVVVFLVLNLFI